MGDARPSSVKACSFPPTRTVRFRTRTFVPTGSSAVGLGNEVMEMEFEIETDVCLTDSIV